MTEPNKPTSSPSSNSNWLILSIVIAFIIACLLAPSLAWVFVVAACMIFLGMYALRPEADIEYSRMNSSVYTAENNQRDFISYQSLAEALQFPAYILDAQGKIIFANKMSKSAFGIVNHRDKIFIRFRQPEIRQFIEQGLSTRISLTGEYNEPIPDDRWFSVEIAPILNSNQHNKDSIFLLGFHDQTKAKRTDQMRSDFIANASHELRTPLASLSGYLETIKGPARKDEKAINRFTDIMLDQAQRMTRLVNDLLSLSRIEMQSHLRPSEKVNLGEVISSVIDSLGSVATQLNIEIEYESTKDIYVLGDRDELLQVFENLIENACKYGEKGKKVIVSLDKSEDKKHVTVSVRDFGPGIALEHQQRITERFYRVDIARSREKQGTGLGLAIVKHILNRHATKLNIESSPNEGARFFIKFSLDDNND